MHVGIRLLSSFLHVPLFHRGANSFIVCGFNTLQFTYSTHTVYLTLNAIVLLNTIRITTLDIMNMYRMLQKCNLI